MQSENIGNQRILSEMEFYDAELIKTVSKAENNGSIVILWAYLIGCCVFFIRFTNNIVGIFRLKQRSIRSPIDDSILLIKQNISPFSFLNNIYLNREDYEERRISKYILKHEKIHCNQLHSYDNIFVELLLVLLWVNPFVWLCKLWIKENHEFLVDQKIIESGVDQKAYSNEILEFVQYGRQPPLGSMFSFQLTKNRLIMMQKSKPKRMKKLIQLSTVVLLMTAVYLMSSFKYINHQNKLVVVIDAGHGGKDLGAQFNDINEKDITLQFINELKTKQNNPNIELLFTRDEDQFMELSQRKSFTDKIKPNLFISLHVNQSDKKQHSGFEIFLPKDTAFHSKSVQAANSISYGLIENKWINEVKLKQGPFYLLKNISSPSLLIELGFISNTSDRAMLTNKKTLEEIVEAFYVGLEKYQSIMTND